MLASVGDIAQTRNLTPYIVRETFKEDGELPGAVAALVDNKAYLPRHRKLQREYGDRVLLKLAELAKSKGKPSRWYATVTSVANWDRTLKMVKKLLAATERAVEAMKKLGVPETWIRWYTGYAYRLTEAQFAYAIEQGMKGRNRGRLAAYLLAHPDRGTK